MSLRVIACALVASGCSAAAPATTPVTMAAGATSVAFVDPDTLAPLVDGGAAQVIHGPQGGYHVLVTLLAHGIWPGTPGVPGSPDDPTTALQAFAADGTELTLMTDQIDTFHVAYAPAGDGVALENKQLRLAITDPKTIANQRLTLHVTLTDKNALTASAQLHIVAIPPTD